MRTTSNPIPDNLRPLVAIGAFLPPFALVILLFLWVRLGADTAAVLPMFGYCLVTLVPLLLNVFVQRRYKASTLPGQGWAVATVFWILALLPLAATLMTIGGIDKELALALPVVLISGFYTSSVVYLVSAIICAYFAQRAAK